MKSSRASEADLNAAGVIAFVATNTEVVPERLVDVAVRYWSSYADEIDAWIREADALEQRYLTHEQVHELARGRRPDESEQAPSARRAAERSVPPHRPVPRVHRRPLRRDGRAARGPHRLSPPSRDGRRVGDAGRLEPGVGHPQGQESARYRFRGSSWTSLPSTCAARHPTIL